MAKGESLSLSVDALDANNAGLVMVSEDETPSFSALPGVEVGDVQKTRYSFSLERLLTFYCRTRRIETKNRHRFPCRTIRVQRLE